MKAFFSWALEASVALGVGASMLLSLAAIAEVPAPKSPVYPCPATVLSVTDGDTIKADILLPWSVALKGEEIRENSYDAWETSKRRHSEAMGDQVTDAEVIRGKAAKAALVALLASGEVYIEPARNPEKKIFGDREVYGRILGKLWVAKGGKWIDVGAEMMAAGHDRRAK